MRKHFGKRIPALILMSVLILCEIGTDCMSVYAAGTDNPVICESGAEYDGDDETVTESYSSEAVSGDEYLTLDETESNESGNPESDDSIAGYGMRENVYDSADPSGDHAPADPSAMYTITDPSNYTGYHEVPGEFDVGLSYEYATDYRPNLRGNGEDELPSSYRTENLPELRYQGFGTCWAHSSLALAEINLMKKGIDVTGMGTDPDLCERHLAYFTYHSTPDPLGGTEGDVNNTLLDYLEGGGNVGFAARILSSWTGAADEASVPQTWEDLRYDEAIDPELAFLDAAHMTGYYKVDINNDPEAAKRLIKDNGALGVSICASESFYSSQNNAFYCPTKYRTNHAVTIVGWDDSFPASSFKTTPDGNGAWLVRNSWTYGGTYDDEDTHDYYGYFWLSYYDRSLEGGYSFIFDTADNYDNNYQYDGGMNTNCCSGYTDTVKAANIFTAKAWLPGEELKAVSFATNTTNANYTINIYKILSDIESIDDPESGDLQDYATVTGMTTYAGAYTIPLSIPVNLSAGDKFAVVVSLSKTGNHPDLLYDCSAAADWYDVSVSSEPGQSFYYRITNSREYWVDFGADNSGNFCIKAYTDNMSSSVNYPVTGISFKDGIEENGMKLSVSETLKARPVVTPVYATDQSLIWTSGNDSVATVDSNGRVTGAGVGTTQITATNPASGISKSFEVSVTNTILSISITNSSDPFFDGKVNVQTGGTLSLSYTVTPEDRPIVGDVVWRSEDDTIATVDENGVVTGVDIGSTRIILEADGRRDTVSVSVSADLRFTCEQDNDFVITLRWLNSKWATKYTLFCDGVKIAEYTPDDRTAYTYVDESHRNASAGTYINYIMQYELIKGNNTYVGSSFGHVFLKTRNRIIYHLNGGTQNPANPEYYDDYAYVSLNAPQKTGYTFLYWCSDPELSDRIDPNISGKTGDIHVYAYFIPNRYTIEYHINDPEDPEATEIWRVWATYDEESELSTDCFAIEGYDITGWNTQADGNGTSYLPGQKVKNLSAVNNAEVHLYARWTAESTASYTVTYHSNDTEDPADEVTSVQSFRVNKASALAVWNHARPGYIFTGWNTARDGSGDSYDPEESVLNLSEDDGANIDLYAQWMEHANIVSFETNGGDEIPSQRVAFGQTAVRPDDPVKDGFLFAGWYMDSLLKTPYDFTFPVLTAMTLYASYTEVTDWTDYGYADEEEIPANLWLSETPESCDYTGSAVTVPDLKVFNGSRRLKAGTDYTVKYSNNTKAGTALLVVTGKGNYSGSIRKNFTIRPLVIGDYDPETGEGAASDTLTVSEISLKYTGKVQKGKPAVVSYKSESGTEMILKQGTDYVLIYPDKSPGAYKAPGEYDILIRGKGNFTGTARIKQKILETGSELKPISRMSVGGTAYYAAWNVPDKAGVIGEITPEFDIRDGDVQLVKNTDYTVNFIQNDRIGTARAIITGIGAYTGSRIVKFKIISVPMSDVKIIERVGSLEYNGTGREHPHLTLKYSPSGTNYTETLVEGRDYKISYSGNRNAGRNKALLTVTGLGAYKGIIKKKFSITAFNIKSGLAEGTISVLPIGAVPYTKNGATPKVTVSRLDSDGNVIEVLKAGTDYKLSYSNNKTVGNTSKPPYVTITGKGNYTGTITESFEIIPTSISGVKLTVTDAVARNRAGLNRPSVTVTDTNGVKLKAGTDYDKNIIFTYADNMDELGKTAGEAVDMSTDVIPAGTELIATVTGKGKYRGTGEEPATLSAPFRVVTKLINKADVRIADQTYTGSVITIDYDDVMRMKVSKKSLTDADYEIDPDSYVNNVRKGKATVILRGTGAFGGYKKVTFKIKQRSMCYLVTYDNNAVFMSDLTGAPVSIRGTMKKSSTAAGAKLTKNAYKLTGYVFDGWNTSPDGTGTHYANAAKLKPDEEMSRNGYGTALKLYAQWRPKQ